MIYHIGDIDKINAFVKDLRDLLEKHNVWMDTTYGGMNTDDPVVTFTSEENLADPDSEVNWFVEIVDMWPQEYNLAKSEYEIERIGGPEDGQIRSNDP